MPKSQKKRIASYNKSKARGKRFRDKQKEKVANNDAEAIKKHNTQKVKRASLMKERRQRIKAKVNMIKDTVNPCEEDEIFVLSLMGDEIHHNEYMRKQRKLKKQQQNPQNNSPKAQNTVYPVPNSDTDSKFDNVQNEVKLSGATELEHDDQDEVYLTEMIGVMNTPLNAGISKDDSKKRLKECQKNMSPVTKHVESATEFAKVAEETNITRVKNSLIVNAEVEQHKEFEIETEQHTISTRIVTEIVNESKKQIKQIVNNTTDIVELANQVVKSAKASNLPESEDEYEWDGNLMPSNDLYGIVPGQILPNTNQISMETKKHCTNPEYDNNFKCNVNTNDNNENLKYATQFSNAESFVEENSFKDNLIEKCNTKHNISQVIIKKEDNEQLDNNNLSIRVENNNNSQSNEEEKIHYTFTELFPPTHHNFTKKNPYHTQSCDNHTSSSYYNRSRSNQRSQYNKHYHSQYDGSSYYQGRGCGSGRRYYSGRGRSGQGFNSRRGTRIPDHQQVYLKQFKVHDSNCNCVTKHRFCQNNSKLYLGKQSLLAFPKMHKNQENLPYVHLIPDGNELTFELEQNLFDRFKERFPNSKISNAECRLKFTKDINSKEHAQNAFVYFYAKKDVKIKDLIEIANKAKLRKHGHLRHDHCKELSLVDMSFNNGDLTVSWGHHIVECTQNVSNEYLTNCMVMKTVHTRTQVINFDLPGGKRRLGENSMKCVIRELEEETSLSIDIKSFKNAIVHKKISEVNIYYYVDVDKI